MSQKVFVPITDELLYAHPELLARLRPFRTGQPCFRWMAEDARAPESEPAARRAQPRREVRVEAAA